MKNKLWGAVGACLMLSAAPAASAKVMVATYTGVITFMLGEGQPFGSETSIGSTVDLTFKYDTSLGQLTDNLPSDISLLGGTADPALGPSPMLLAAIRIDGVSRAFIPESEGSISFDYANNDLFHSGRSCPSYCITSTADFHPASLPASLTSRWDGDGTGEGNFTFITPNHGSVFAFVDLQHLSISSAPEPAVWLSLTVGLFGGRRGPARPAAADGGGDRLADSGVRWGCQVLASPPSRATGCRKAAA